MMKRMIKWFGLGAILLASCTEKVVSPQYMETYPFYLSRLYGSYYTVHYCSAEF